MSNESAPTDPTAAEPPTAAEANEGLETHPEHGKPDEIQED